MDPPFSSATGLMKVIVGTIHPSNCGIPGFSLASQVHVAPLHSFSQLSGRPTKLASVNNMEKRTKPSSGPPITSFFVKRSRVGRFQIS